MVCSCENINIGTNLPHINLQDFRNIISSTQETEIVNVNIENINYETLDTVAFQAGASDCAKILIVYNNNDSIYIRTNGQWCIMCGSDGYYGTNCTGIVDRGTPEGQFVNEGFSNPSNCERLLVLDNENFEAWIKPNTSGTFKKIIQRGIDCGMVIGLTQKTPFLVTPAYDGVSYFNNFYVPECVEDTVFLPILSFKKNGFVKISFSMRITFVPAAGTALNYYSLLISQNLVEVGRIAGYKGHQTNDGVSGEIVFKVSNGNYITMAEYINTTNTAPIQVLSNYKRMNILFWED